MSTDQSWSKTSRTRPHSTSCSRTIPIFIANTAKHYLFIEEIANDLPHYLARGKAGFHELLTDFLTGKGTLEQSDWAWDELFAFVRAATQTPVRNPLLTTYWTMAAVRHGDYVAKIRVAPAAESATHVIHANSTSPVDRRCFVRRWWTSCKREHSISISRSSCARTSTRCRSTTLTVEWPEKLSPFVTVGRVHLPRQDISGPENFEKGDALAFNQWRVTSDHRPLGEIMNVRRIYSASAKVRRTLNHQPQTEPTSADSVLP